MKKILLGTPRAGFSQVEAIDNHMDMAFYMGRKKERGEYEVLLASLGRIFVAKAREEFAEYAIELNCDYLMMIDDDMLVPEDLFERLAKHDVDIVAPLAFMRRYPYLPVIYKTSSGWDSVRKEAFFQNAIVKTYPKNTLLECDAVGFGAVLIKIEVLKKLKRPRFMSTNPTGEDILFCFNAREQARAKVYCDTSVIIQHLGAPIIIGETEYEEANDIDRLRKVHGDYDPKVHSL